MSLEVNPRTVTVANIRAAGRILVRDGEPADKFESFRDLKKIDGPPSIFGSTWNNKSAVGARPDMLCAPTWGKGMILII